MIYFDYTATTPINDEVLETYIKTQKNFFANANSYHKLGQMSNYMYEKATNELKNEMGLNKYKVIYTSNATEANNLAIFGVVDAYEKGKVITTKIEHPSVFEVFKSLESRGFEVVYLDVDNNGVIDLNQLKNEMTKDVILVSIMWVNNIIGSIQPIKKVIEIVKEFPKAKLHVDIVQGICKIKANFDFNKIDLLTFSGHKIYAPKGIGALIVKEEINLEKRIYGSQSQYGIKPGTFDLALIVALCKAVKIFMPKVEEHYSYVEKLNNKLRDSLKNSSKYVINSPLNASPYIFNISCNNIKGETLLHYLEDSKIYVSTGSACSSKLQKPERTILAITNSEALATAAVRISLSHLTTFDEIEKLIKVLEKM